MVLFIGFLLAAAISGFIFKILAGIFEGILIFPLFGFRGSSFEHAMATKPKRFITAIIFKNVIIGLANSVMILTLCYKFVVEAGGNQWLYFVVGTIWSLYIIVDGKAFTGVFFWTSTINFVLMWFGFGAVSLIAVGLLTFVISLSYYYGRIGMFNQVAGDDTTTY